MKMMIEVDIDDAKAASLARAWDYLRGQSGMRRYTRSELEDAYREMAEIGLFAVEADMAAAGWEGSPATEDDAGQQEM